MEEGSSSSDKKLLKMKPKKIRTFTDHKDPITCLHWAEHPMMRVFSGDEAGKVFLTYLPQKVISFDYYFDLL